MKNELSNFTRKPLFRKEQFRSEDGIKISRFFFFKLPVWNLKMLYYCREAHLQRKVLKKNIEIVKCGTFRT